MLKFALVGCGRIAKRHAELLGGGQLPFARLVGVGDIQKDRARDFHSIYKVPYFTDLQAMMIKIDTDVVSVPAELTQAMLLSSHRIASMSLLKSRRR